MSVILVTGVCELIENRDSIDAIRPRLTAVEIRRLHSNSPSGPAANPVCRPGINISCVTRSKSIEHHYAFKRQPGVHNRQKKRNFLGI